MRSFTSEASLDAYFEAENYLYFHQDDFLSLDRTQQELRFLREHLSISKTTSVIDLACGHGRHASELAAHARLITGIDKNGCFLDMARARAKSEVIQNVTYLQGDIRQLDIVAQYERAILLNTVFGLFSDQENAGLLRSVNIALKPDGLFCFDVINRDTVLVDFQPYYISEKDDNLLIDRCSFDEQSGRITNRRIYLKDGRRTDAGFSLRIYNYTELVGLLAAARMRILRAFADWSSTPMHDMAKKIVIIALKEGEIG